MNVAIPRGPLYPLVPRRLVWFIPLAQPVFSLAEVSVSLPTGRASRFDLGLWFAVSMTMFVLLRAASRASTRRRAIAAAAAAGGLSMAVFRLAMRCALWQHMWLTPFGMFGLHALPGEILIFVFLAAVEALRFAVFALIVAPSSGTTSVERSDWTTLGAALWVVAPLVVPPAALSLFGKEPVPLLQVVLPLALSAAVAGRIVYRRRWVRRVAEKRVPGWRIVDAAEAPTPRPPVLVGSPKRIVGLLVRTVTGSQPFRATYDEAVACLGAAGG